MVVVVLVIVVVFVVVVLVVRIVAVVVVIIVVGVSRIPKRAPIDEVERQPSTNSKKLRKPVMIINTPRAGHPRVKMAMGDC